MSSSAAPGDGTTPAAGELFTALERELHAIAERMVRGERVGHTLQPTALLHEAWLRLDGIDNPWSDEAHFLRAAAGTMRRILVDHARRRLREKRGGEAQRITLAPELLDARETPHDLLVVDEVLTRLGEVDVELVRIVELRVFGGLTHAQIAAALDCSLRSVERGWRLARAFLRREFDDDSGS